MCNEIEAFATCGDFEQGFLVVDLHRRFTFDDGGEERVTAGSIRIHQFEFASR